MMNTESAGENDLVIEFAKALKDALDQINYPSSPERVSKLMDLLALSKPQVYRITTGKAAPTLESLVKFRELNISIDAILDGINDKAVSTDNKIDEWLDGRIDIAGTCQRCVLKLSPLTKQTSVIAILSEDTVWHVTGLPHGSIAPDGAMCVDEIRLKNAHPHLAILDDDPNTLTALCKQLDSVFDVSPFSEGKALLRSPLVSRFDGYLLDWRLEDISGEELVTSIRRLSDAPIFIVTGQKSSNEIARIIASANIRYVVKPIDEVILAAELMNAIKLHGISRRLIS